MLVDSLLKKESVAFDTETTSLDAISAELVGMSFSYAAGKAYYVAVPEEKQAAQGIVDLFKPFFENEKIEKIGQNLKYDMTVLENYGVAVKGALFDTMLAHYLIQPDMRHNMDVLAETYLNYRPVSIETLIGKKGKSQGSMRNVEPEKVSEYAGEDADITFQLKQVFAPKLEETEVKDVFADIETPLVPVLADMEYAGVKIDVAGLNEYSATLQAEIDQLQEEITTLAGVAFNIGSPKQLGEVLFDKLKLVEKPKKTKTGSVCNG
jgi:DNA polymerase-1